MKKFRRSSAVEQLTVNQLVLGSIPTAGAKNNTLAGNARCFFMSDRTIKISAPVRQVVGCAIEFSLADSVILNTGCAPLRMCRHLL